FFWPIFDLKQRLGTEGLDLSRPVRRPRRSGRGISPSSEGFLSLSECLESSCFTFLRQSLARHIVDFLGCCKSSVRKPEGFLRGSLLQQPLGLRQRDLNGGDCLW